MTAFPCTPAWIALKKNPQAGEQKGRNGRPGARRTFREPPIGRSPDSRTVGAREGGDSRIAFPNPEGQWRLMRLRSITVAGAVPGSLRELTGFP